jgi:hypothetical protein
MKKEDFEHTLRALLRAEPFQPFIVDLENGKQVHISQPTVAFNDGFAGYLNPAYELVEFACEDVRQIHLESKAAV